MGRSGADALRFRTRHRQHLLAQVFRQHPFESARAQRLMMKPRAVHDAAIWVSLCDARVECTWFARGEPVAERVVAKPVPRSRKLGPNAAATRTFVWSDDALQATLACLGDIKCNVADDAQVCQMYRIFFATRTVPRWHSFYSALITDVNMLFAASDAERVHSSQTRMRRPRGLDQLHAVILEYRDPATQRPVFRLAHLQALMIRIFQALGVRPLRFLVMNAIHRHLGGSRKTAARAVDCVEDMADYINDNDAQVPDAEDDDEAQAAVEVELFGEDSDTDASDDGDDDDAAMRDFDAE